MSIFKKTLILSSAISLILSPSAMASKRLSGAGDHPNPTAKGAYPIATLTWILAYKTGNGRNTKAIQDTFYKLLSDEYQSKAPPLGFVPLKGDILEKSITAFKKIGR